MTAATQPSIEDAVGGALPWIPKVRLLNQFLSFENGDDFLTRFHLAAEGKVDPFMLVVEGSIPNEKNKAEGYWAALGRDAVTGLFGFLYFGMVDTAYPSAVFIAIVLSLIPHDMMYGPQAALIAEAFTPRLRYSGASIGYQLASIIAGGPAPFISTWLFATYN